MQYIFLLFILCGLYELSEGIQQCFRSILYNYPFYTITGTFKNPGPFSLIIAIILPIAWFYTVQIRFFIKQQCIFYKIITVLSVIYILLSLIVLPLCMSRTSWIAVIVSCIVVAYLCIDKYRIRGALFSLIIIILVSCMMGGVYGLKKESADGRFLIWKISLSIVKKNPILGVGRGCFPGVYGNEQEIYFREGRGSEYEENIAGAPSYAYNEYLQILVEYGICGLLAYILFIIYAFYRLIRSNSKEAVAIMGALISLLTVSLFSYPFRNFYTCLLSVCILILAIFTPFMKSADGRWHLKGSFIALFLLLVVTFYLCKYFGKFGNTRIAYKQWNLLRPYYNESKFDIIAKNYDVLYPYLKLDADFLFEYGQCLSHVREYNASNKILQEGLKYSADPMFLSIIGKNSQCLGLFQEAEKMFYKAYFRIPHKIYPLYLLMNLYEREGRITEMLAILDLIINKKEKVNSVETKFIKDKALEKSKKYRTDYYKIQ